MPLHPALVHVPLGLGAVLGVVLLSLLLLERRGASTRALWWVGAALAAIVAVGALAASSAGEDEALRLSRRLPAAALAVHEEAAETFTVASVLLALLTLSAGVAARPRTRLALQIASIALGLALAPLGLRAGHAGGALVWEHGAAARGTSDVPRAAVDAAGP